MPDCWDWTAADSILAVGLAVLACALSVVSVVLSRRRPAEPTPPRAGPAADPFLEGAPRERRAAPRHAGATVRVLIAAGDSRAVPETGWVFDRSLGGLGLLMERPAGVGDILSV